MTTIHQDQQSLSMAVTHLNAPYGAIVCANDLSDSLVHGEIRASSTQAAAIMSYLFIEVEPRLVMQCAMESGATLPQANQLYSDTVKKGAPRNAVWESSVRDLL